MRHFKSEICVLLMVNRFLTGCLKSRKIKNIKVKGNSVSKEKMMEFTQFFLRIIYKIQWLLGGICNLPDNQLCASNSKVFVKIYFVNIMRYFRCDHVAYTMMCCSLQREEYPGIKTSNFNLKILSILQYSLKPFENYNLVNSY